MSRKFVPHETHSFVFIAFMNEAHRWLAVSLLTKVASKCVTARTETASKCDYCVTATERVKTYDVTLYIINRLILTYCICFILSISLFQYKIEYDFKDIIIICNNSITLVSTRLRQIYVLV